MNLGCTYAGLPDSLHRAVVPDARWSGRLQWLNRPLAQQLGLDP